MREMTDKRWLEVMNDMPNVPLTQEEIDNGWHFCWDWDGLLVGPGMIEQESCLCVPQTK